MITFEGVAYYTQDEIADYLHCTKPTIANKICVAGIQGVRFGRKKYYMAEQRAQLLTTPTTKPKEQ